jgi:hypothetical protein
MLKDGNLIVRFANHVFVWLERISRHKIAMCLLVMAAMMGGRLALLPWKPIPHPYVADEFSYLLGAETFASGRLTNPTPPMFEHFETFHELMQPTYMSMYPPGQSLFLAVGLKLLGIPWFGVWISFGLFAACLCWMLQNWLPPVYAFLGTLITLANISILGYWMNSYWGGAVAASAGCILLGTLPRLAKQLAAKDVILASIGLLILANTRPYEGLVMSIAAFVGLLFLRRRQGQSLTGLFSTRCVIPFLLICGAGAVWDGYYNYRVTGNAFEMPYVAYSQDYRSDPLWIMLPERKPPVYRNTDLAKNWQVQTEHFRKIRSDPRLLLTEAYTSFKFFCPSLFVFPLAVGMMLARSYRFWTLAMICLFVWCSFLIETNHTPHYIAGSVGLLPVMGMYGFRWLRVVSKNYGPVFVLTLTSMLCLQGFNRRGDERGCSWETRPPNFMSPRMIATKLVTERGGRSLIFVQYSTNHIDKSDECVFNGANMDASPIVWAHDMGRQKNRELVNYYRGSRTVWLYQPDKDADVLTPYDVESHLTNN